MNNAKNTIIITVIYALIIYSPGEYKWIWVTLYCTITFIFFNSATLEHANRRWFWSCCFLMLWLVAIIFNQRTWLGGLWIRLFWSIFNYVCVIKFAKSLPRSGLDKNVIRTWRASTQASTQDSKQELLIFVKRKINALLFFNLFASNTILKLGNVHK